MTINLKLILSILVVTVLEMRLTFSSTSSAMRNWPFQFTESGYFAPMTNGSYSGVGFNYTVTFQNAATLKNPMVILGIRTFKSANPTSSIDYIHTINRLNFSRMIVFVGIGNGFSLQYLEINYLKTDVGYDECNIQLSNLFWDDTNKSRGADPNYEGLLTHSLNVSAFTSYNYYKNTSLPESTNRLIIFLNVLNMTSNQGKLNQLYLYTGYRNQVFVTVNVFKPLGVRIILYRYAAIYYSTAVSSAMSSRSIRWGGTFNFSETGGTRVTANMWSQSVMFTGLAFIQVHNESSVIDYQSSFSMSLKPTVTVFEQNPYSPSNFGLKSTITSYFHEFRYYCSNTSHAFNTVDNICYNVCPAGTVRSNFTYYPKCFGCSYKCATCSDSSWDPGTGTQSTCSSCSAGNFRILVSGVCKCVNSSYFDDGYSKTCRTCSSVVVGTESCEFSLDSSQSSRYYQGLFAGNWTTNVLPLYKSLSCSAGYVIQSNLCRKCELIIPYCTSCSNASQCTTCNASIPATKYTDGKCYLCDVTNCVVCRQDDVCDQCEIGYIMNGSVCVENPCNSTCTCGGFYLPKVNDTCSTICGDGIKVGSEQCDDNNTLDRDGCSSLCIIETCEQNCSCDGWYFPLVNDSCSTQCGDGFRVGYEQCDDGNTINHDGCSSTCIIETCDQNCSCDGYIMPVVNDICSTQCGDGILAGFEQCDDGNTINHDGCSSECKIQPCNVTCNCQGWYLPRIEGVCTSVCGDGYKTTGEQCDDGNSDSHDGCNSDCEIQTQCNQSCLCGGWTQPFVNGSCSTICGDGIIQGLQECDGNTVTEDGCSEICTFDLLGTIVAQQSLFFSQEKTQFASLVLFGMGIRIVGMEMLWVYQSFQLLLQTQPSSPIRISNNIHGYSDKQGFPFRIPNVQNQLFDKFNYMFLLILLVFVMCTFFETLGQCCRSGNQIANVIEEEPLSFSTGPNGLKQKSYQFEDERDNDGNQQFTVHYDKKSMYKNDLLSQTQALSVQLTELEDPVQPLTFFSRLSRIILRQFFFDLIFNVQPVIFTSLVTQIISNGVQSIMNFPTLITFGVIQLFFVGALLFCWRGGQFFGQNQAKFKENKFINYWMVTSVQKVLISTIMGGKFNYYVYSIIGIKFCVMLYFVLNKVYHSKVQHYRSIVIQFLHFALFTTFAVNQAYLSPSGVIYQLPQNFLEMVYTVILGIVFVISLAFYIKQFKQKCQADNRKAEEQKDNQIPDRIFCSRREIEDYGAKMRQKIIPTSFSVLDDIRSRKIVRKQTINSQISKYTQRTHQNHQEQAEYYEDTKPRHKNLYESRRKQQQFDTSEGNRMSHFRETQDDFGVSKYANTTKSRSYIKSARRAGRKQDINKQNSPYKIRYEEQSQQQSQNYNQQAGSPYRVNNQNQSKISKVKRTRTQRNVKSHRNMTREEEQSYDYDNNYDAVSIRFR